MFCPHCHNKIPDGSNICPLCYSNLAGLKAQSAAPKAEPRMQDAPEREPARKSSKSGKSSKKAAYTKGSRGGKKNADKTPMIIAFGLIVILIVIIAMIVMSMFGAGDPKRPAASNAPAVQNSPAGNFVVFGATPTPTPRVVVTPTPVIEVTPTPAPAAPVTYTTLRKGDEGPDVVTLQQALAELGYLTGAADGNFGTGTQTAVKKFQEDKGLAADGIAGKMTLEELYKASSVTPIPESTVGPDDIMNLPG
ncbi:MAG: peptidoglycan-binding protein [Clostridia bacterium]|nr:peptidoglycan-binding protein [Clostridia bacterium]